MKKKIFAAALSLMATACFVDTQEGRIQVDYISPSEASHPLADGTYNVCETSIGSAHSDCRNFIVSRQGNDYLYRSQTSVNSGVRVRVRTLVESTNEDSGVYLIERGIQLAVAREIRSPNGNREIVIYESRCSDIEPEDYEDFIEQGVFYRASRVFCRVTPSADMGLLAGIMMVSARKTHSFRIN